MISREEGLLILGKLHAENAVVALIGALFGLSFVFKGRIVELSHEGFLFVPLDGSGNVSVGLEDDDLLFGYGEPSGLPPDKRAEVPETALRAAGLVIAFPIRVTAPQIEVWDGLTPPERERIFVMEIP